MEKNNDSTNQDKIIEIQQEKEKPTKQEKKAMFELILLALLLAFLTATYFILARARDEAEAHVYTIEEIEATILHPVKNLSFNIEVENVRKEKGKEDIYEISGTLITDNEATVDNEYNFNNIILSKTDFDRHIGQENNTLTTNIYILRLKTKGVIKSKDLYLNLYRYSCFDEKNFTKEEQIKSLHLSTDIFTQLDRHEESTFFEKEQPIDVSKMGYGIQATKISY